MKSMRIQHRNGSYEVKFQGLEAALAALPEDLRIITDSNVVDFYGPLIEARGGQVVIVDAGEASKSLETFGKLLSWLAASRASRKTTVCALGGGVIGDLAGFVAASYMRGVPFYQIPTTLLSQVDSSVGGKVGIDLKEGKNLAGAFYPPMGVSIPIDALASLPVRQFDNGMAEVWKYGFIMDAELVDLLAREKLHAEHELVPSVVERCIALKAQVVEADEFETTGLRAILNYGHTIGHAIEYATGFGAVLHGEAIAIGMVVEARLGEMLGVTPAGVTEAVKGYLCKQDLPTRHLVLYNEDELIKAIYGDKKTVGARLSFSLLTDIGRCKLVEEVPESLVREALRAS
jgi:3-dehydroquinate synthase